MVLRRLLEWGVGDWWKVLAGIAVWPLVWFVAMLIVVQAGLGLALLVRRLLGLPWKVYDAIACTLTLAAFAWVAWSEISGGCPVGYWLGLAGFAAIGVGAAYEAIYQTARR